MKIDLSVDNNLGRVRTCRSLMETMYQLLQTDSFEKLSVQRICEVSQVPRSTFYNYFEDKYDLLQTCFARLKKEYFTLYDSFQGTLNDGINVIQYMFSWIETHIEEVQRIYDLNGKNSEFLALLVKYIMEFPEDEGLYLRRMGFIHDQANLAKTFSDNIFKLLLVEKLEHMETFQINDATVFLVTTFQDNALEKPAKICCK